MRKAENQMRLCISLLTLNLLFIWGNSMLSAEVSRAFSDWVKGILAALFGQAGSPGGGGLLRKIAHFTEFTALGMCLCWLLLLLEKRRAWGVLWGGLAACVDETIQVFVPGRGPGIKDVGIDVLGVCAGILILTLGNAITKRIQRKQNIQEDTK